MSRSGAVGAAVRRGEARRIAAGSDTRQIALVPPGSWEVDARQSTVAFEVRHLKLSRVRGRFHAATGTISVGEDGRAAIAGSIDVSSIDTGDARRDARLRAHEFFDVDHHPTISFSGAAVGNGGGNGLAVRGTMSIRGVARPVQLRAEPSQAEAPGEAGEQRVRARGLISRREFGMEWDSAFAAGGLVIDDRVVLLLDVLLRRAR